MPAISNTLFATARKTGAGAVAAAGGTAALKSAGVSAVRHFCGKWIATKAGLYLAGTIGAPATVVAVAPVTAVVLTVATVGLALGGAVAVSRGL